jgi:hypothetical protein
VMAVPGYCGVFTRRFLNSLCSFDGCRYLEIGTLMGASVAAVVSGNAVSAVAIDDWSEFDGSSRAVVQNLRGKMGRSSVDLRSANCFSLDPAELGPFDVYYYDGPHEEESHRLAVERFVTTLEPLSVLVVDDWNWERVRAGTRAGLAAADVELLWEKEIQLLPADVEGMPRHRGRHTWWNGIAVFLLERPGARPRPH